MSDNIDLRQYLEIALKALHASNEILLAGFNQLGYLRNVRTKSHCNDVVTDVDLQSQKAIVDLIHTQFSSHRFLAEEGEVAHVGKDSPFRWVVDPLDGTLNFVRGFEQFGTIIALQQEYQTILAVMSLPCKNIIISATRDGGTFLNGQRKTIPSGRPLAEAYLLTNLIQSALRNEDGLRVILPSCAHVSGATCVIDVVHKILMGDIDGAYFRSIPQWDVLAGCLAVQEAGGASALELEHPDDQETKAAFAVMCGRAMVKDLCHFLSTSPKARAKM